MKQRKLEFEMAVTARVVVELTASGPRVAEVTVVTAGLADQVAQALRDGQRVTEAGKVGIPS